MTSPLYTGFVENENVFGSTDGKSMEINMAERDPTDDH